jgi:hypothetical protein
MDSFVLPWLAELARESYETDPNRHKAIEHEIVLRAESEARCDISLFLGSCGFGPQVRFPATD